MTLQHAEAPHLTVVVPASAFGNLIGAFWPFLSYRIPGHLRIKRLHYSDEARARCLARLLRAGSHRESPGPSDQVAHSLS